MKQGLLWGTLAGLLAFLASLFFQTRAIVMNFGGIVAPVAFLTGIVVLLRGASFEEGVAVRDDAKSQRRLRWGIWLVFFALPILLIAFLCWGLWPMPSQ